MDSYNVADGKARFSELITRAEAGEEIEIKRRGEVVAKIGPAKKPRKKVDVDALRRITAGQKNWIDHDGDGSWVAWARRTDQL